EWLWGGGGADEAAAAHGRPEASAPEELRAAPPPCDVASALRALASLRTDPSWSCACEEETVAFFTRDDADGAVEVAVEAKYDAPVASLLSLPREFDLLQGWNDFVQRSVILHEPSLLSLRGYAELWMPPPLYPRSFLFDAEGHDLIDDDGCFLILVKDADPSTPGIPESDADCYRGRILPGTCVKLTPMPGERVVAHVHVRVDLQMLGVPGSMLQWLVWTVGPYVHGEMQRLLLGLQEEDNQYRKRIESNRALYGLVERRSAELCVRGGAAAEGADRPAEEKGG
ncbi:unnamed protein product, partial [Prorocentrum cordatum]